LVPTRVRTTFEKLYLQRITLPFSGFSANSNIHKKIRGSSNKVFSKGPRLIRDYPQLTVTGAAGPATTGE